MLFAFQNGASETDTSKLVPTYCWRNEEISKNVGDGTASKLERFYEAAS
jgi:hypothetical protein